MEPFMSSCSSSSTRKRDLISFDEPSLWKRAKIDAFVKYSYECNGRVRPKNDVFLNYSYEDTGNGFVSHLKGGLERKGFTISDHTMLPIGKDESSELRKAVADSEISLVVFSINYSFSVRCLDELVYIMDCHSNPDFKIKRKVFPIFFNVDPSHVRSQQKGSFQKAFEAHERNFDPKRVHKWRQALSGAGHLSGLVVQNGVDEAELILRIVEELEQTQSPQELHVTDYPVGIESRVGELISKLRLDCKDPLILGVFGSSGSGYIYGSMFLLEKCRQTSMKFQLKLV